MTITISIPTLNKFTALLGLLVALGCSANTGEAGGEVRSNVNGACKGESDEGAADKVVCSIDTDCDSDEVCLNGKCIGLDGDAEEDDADEAKGSAQTDDEAGADKINCATDADCDSDEACKNGHCD